MLKRLFFLATVTIVSISLLVACGGGGSSGPAGDNGGIDDGTTGDTTAPSIPEGVTASVPNSEQIDIKWQEAKDNVGVHGYKIYRDGVLFKTFTTTTTTKTVDNDVPGGTGHCYAVSAFDEADNESARSTESCATAWAWKTATVASPDSQAGAFSVGEYSSIAVDSSGKAHISHMEQFSGADTNLRYASNVSGTWTDEIIEAGGSYSAMAIDQSGNMHIVHYDQNAVELRYVKGTSGSWTSETVESGTYCERIALAVDASGVPHVSFIRNTYPDVIVYATKAGGSWVTESVTTGSFVYGTAIALDQSGKVHISFYTDTTDEVKYATNRTGSWVVETVESDILTDSALFLSTHSAIGVDADGNVHICYPNYKMSGLRYATNASGSWALSWITTSYGAEDASLVMDDAGKVHISYNTALGGVRYATNNSGAWTVDSVDGSGDDRHTSIALDAAGAPHISYHEDTDHSLRYATK